MERAGEIGAESDARLPDLDHGAGARAQDLERRADAEAESRETLGRPGSVTSSVTIPRPKRGRSATVEQAGRAATGGGMGESGRGERISKLRIVLN